MKLLISAIITIALILGVAVRVVGGSLLGAASADAPAPLCPDSSLTLSQQMFNVAATDASAIYVVTNNGAAACQLQGMPALSIVDANGQSLASVVQQQVPGAATSIQLNPGDSASFSADIGDCAAGAAPQAASESSAQLVWTFPGEASGLPVPGASPPVSQTCNSFAATVSTLQQGVISAPVGFTPFPPQPPTCGPVACTSEKAIEDKFNSHRPYIRRFIRVFGKPSR